MIKIFRIEDFFSLFNASFGFLALMMIFLGEIRFSFTFILLAVLADGLDGIIARYKGNQSQVGDFLEPMADMLSMGVAPVFFAYVIYRNEVFDCFKCHFMFLGVLFFFFICVVIRLSSFYVLKNNKYFIGVPVPAAAIILVLLPYIKLDLYIILTVVFILSLLMISNFHFKKPVLKINLFAAILIFLAIIFDKGFNDFFLWLLLFAVIFYSFYGPIYQKVKKQ